MLKKLQNNKGFTIIEVMIVLAIAGLIILIVLLAVPALQRNGRNTTLKNDATKVAAAVSEFKSNNDGVQPTSISTTQVTGPAGTTPANYQLSAGMAVTNTAAPAVGAIGTQVGAACPGSTSPAARSVAVRYQVEPSGIRCIES